MWKAIDGIGAFIANLFTALKFATFDYDVTIRRTRIPKQRIIIWVVIFTVVIGGILLSLFLLGDLVRAIVHRRMLYQN